MSWTSCFDDSSDAETVALERLPGDKRIMLKGHDKLWHPKRQNSRSRVHVSGNNQDVGWVVWQSENIRVMFGRIVQNEGENIKIRFITKGRGNRLIVGKKKNYSPNIDTNTSDPRLFEVVGSWQNNDLHLKHCKSGLNVIVDNRNFLVISNSPGRLWEISSVSDKQENQRFLQEQENIKGF